MPFKSTRQMRFMFSQHPDIANRWVAEAKAKKKPVVSKSLDMWEGVTAVSKSDPDVSAVHVPGSGGRKGKFRRVKPPRSTCM